MTRPAVTEETVQEGNQWVRYRTSRCSRCGATDRVKDFRRRPDPESWTLNELHKRGWREVWRASRIHCPACAASATPTQTEPKAEVIQMKRTTKPEPAQFAPLASDQAKTALLEAQAQLATTKAEALKAETPRNPTREDRRRIQDKLETTYDEKRGCYLQGYDDEWLAQQLKVPRAWVASIREDFFGPNLTAEEKAASDQLGPMRETLIKLRDDGLDLATRAENALADLNRIVANLTKAA